MVKVTCAGVTVKLAALVPWVKLYMVAAGKLFNQSRPACDRLTVVGVALTLVVAA